MGKTNFPTEIRREKPFISDFKKKKVPLRPHLSQSLMGWHYLKAWGSLFLVVLHSSQRKLAGFCSALLWSQLHFSCSSHLSFSSKNANLLHSTKSRWPDDPAFSDGSPRFKTCDSAAFRGYIHVASVDISDVSGTLWINKLTPLSLHSPSHLPLPAPVHYLS